MSGNCWEVISEPENAFRMNTVRLPLRRQSDVELSMLACGSNSVCCAVSSVASVVSDSLQPALSTRFSRQEYWSGLPCPPPRDLPDSGIKLHLLCISCIAGRFFFLTDEPPGKPGNQAEIDSGLDSKFTSFMALGKTLLHISFPICKTAVS